MKILNTHFIDNSVSSEAGAITISYLPHLEIYNSSFIGNKCFNGPGGAIVMRNTMKKMD